MKLPATTSSRFGISFIAILRYLNSGRYSFGIDDVYMKPGFISALTLNGLFIADANADPYTSNNLSVLCSIKNVSHFALKLGK